MTRPWLKCHPKILNSNLLTLFDHCSGMIWLLYIYLSNAFNPKSTNCLFLFRKRSICRLSRRNLSILSCEAVLLKIHSILKIIALMELEAKIFWKFYAALYFTCREDHPQSLIDSVSSIIASILAENVETDPNPLERNTFQPLLDVILRNIIKEKKVIL